MKEGKGKQRTLYILNVFSCHWDQRFGKLQWVIT